MSIPADVATARAENEALEWLVDFENLTEEEQQRFAAWLDERPENGAAFARLEREWRRLDVVRRLADETPEPDPEVVVRWLRRRRRRRWRPLAAAAVVAAIAVTLLLPVPGDFEARYATDIGQQRDIRLPDASVMTLNTDSQAAVHYSGDERRVSLLQGEAHFEVAPDPARPFSVVAGAGTVRAVGTAFNVYLKGDVVEVTVSEGVVEILPSARTKAPAGPGPAAATLRQGETIEYGAAVEAVSRIDPKEILRQRAWQDGMLDFRGETLADVIAEAGRYTSVHIDVEDPAIENLHVTGYFRAGDVDTLLRLIESNERVAVHRDPAGDVRITARSDDESSHRQ